MKLCVHRAEDNSLRLRPCCTDQGCGRNDPYPVLGSCDADGLRASQLEHAVQRMNGNVHLGCPTLIRAGAQPVTDHLLEPVRIPTKAATNSNLIAATIPI